MEEKTYNNQQYIKPDCKLIRIKVEKLRMRAYIGFKKWETEKLQELIINFSFRYNAAKAIATDREEDVLDYKAITKKVIHHVDRQSFHLLEKVAEDILEIIRGNPYTRDIVVRVEKPHALRFSDNVWVEVEGNDRLNEAIIGMGSNIEPESNIKNALESLSKVCGIRNQSKFIYTEPEKLKDQARFLNGAVVIDTPLPFEELKSYLKSLEDQMGRQRSGPQNGPRNIDLDIILYNGSITDEEVYEYSFLQQFLRELRPDLEFDF
ncbi:MAG TPA: 2-amino-4-hydroxy-6-hydroxymethyldihydropteridine diphosphokinase [Membranihabitans sp.]|nr:2-amino-4-hydroxy-6-hydroxymethyldihydropteridine diphosphokinase [Membranihabitans sp.]